MSKEPSFSSSKCHHSTQKYSKKQYLKNNNNNITSQKQTTKDKKIEEEGINFLHENSLNKSVDLGMTYRVKFQWERQIVGNYSYRCG